MHPKTLARRAALLALERIEGGDLLAQAIEGAQRTVAVPAQTRPFLRELTSGTLRHGALLDWTLECLLKKPLAKLDAAVRAALRLAAYERCFLSTPASAVANEYASLMRVARLSSATAFVNAITRRLPDETRPVPAEWPAARRIGVEFSHPQWLVEAWLARRGEAECAALCRANNEVAALCLRVNSLRASRDDVLAEFLKRGLKAWPGELSPDAIWLSNAGAPHELPEWSAGLVIAQDEAAQLVCLLAAPRPGSVVIDCAAAPGGKTTHLAQLMGDSGMIIACDAAPGRIKLVQENARRLGIYSIAPRAGDLRALAHALPPAELVLLDAPCLGTGTLRRRPDAKARKTPEQLAELVVLQRELLDAAAPLVGPGGVLVYSTCSLEAAENEEQVAAFLQRHTGWMVAARLGVLADATVARVTTPERFVQTLPHVHGCDGAFAVKLVREPAT